MYRRPDYNIENYDKDGIKVSRVNVGEEYDVGEWCKHYEPLALSYMSDKERSIHYGDIAYKIVVNREIIGYFIAQTEVCTEDGSPVGKYEKSLVLYDLALDSEEKLRHGKILIDFLVYVARCHGCSAVKISTAEDFTLFYSFVECHYGAVEAGEYYYIQIDDPAVFPGTEHLRLYGDDNVCLEDIYFLWSIGLEVDRERCVMTLAGGEEISVCRKSGIITLPSSVINEGGELYLNARTRNLLHYIVRAYKYGELERLYLGRRLGRITLEASTDTEIFLFDAPNDVSKNIELGYFALKHGYKWVWAYSITYDMNEDSFCESVAKLDVEKTILSHSCYLDREQGYSISKELARRRRSKEINERLREKLTRIDFVYGEGECAMRLSLIITDTVRAEHNGTLDNAEVKYDRAELLSDLYLLNLVNWKEEYSSDGADSDELWELSFTHTDGTVTYRGRGAYPRIWFVVADILERYSGHVLP